MEENKIKETIEDLERNIRSIREDIDKTESIIEIPKLRDRVRVLQNALDIAVCVQNYLQRGSSSKVDIFILEGNERLKMGFFVKKLKEETDEVIQAYDNFDRENVKEEVLDVLQVGVGILARMGLSEIEIKKAVDMHNAKLDKRGFARKYAALSLNLME